MEYRKYTGNTENERGRDPYAPLVNTSRTPAKYRNIAELKYWSNAVAREDGNHGRQATSR